MNEELIGYDPPPESVNKFCADCRHSIEYYDEGYRCTRNCQFIRSLVTGKIERFGHTKSCKRERAEKVFFNISDRCGASGKFWSSKNVD